MLASKQESAPAQLLPKAESPAANVFWPSASNDHHDARHSFFWDANNLSSHLNAVTGSDLKAGATPKTVSERLLDHIPERFGADLLLELNPQSLGNGVAQPSSPPTATTASGSLIFSSTASGSACDSSPAMSASSNYHFETPSLHQISALGASFSTSSPSIGSVGNADASSVKTSPSQHNQAWHKDAAGATGTYQPYGAGQNQYEDHDYQGHGVHPAMSQYFHRASISGPLMASASQAERYEETPAPAPPRLHGLAAWENASGSARPHTADGMFGQFGAVSMSAPSHESSTDGSAMPSMAGAQSRPYTPGGDSAHLDNYYQDRRMSMPDPSSGGAAGTGKVFSYMAPTNEGSMMSSGSHVGMPSHGYGGHYFGSGGGYSGASKKRPRRRYDEIERLYPCSWAGCTKSYGTLNHLNAHVAMQKHGPKRSPSEFKDMRKAWRKQKKEEEQRRQSRQLSLGDQALRSSFSGSAYADMSAGQSELLGGSSGAASALPIAPPPALSGFGGQHGGSAVYGSAQLPAPMAHLSRYSMSSVSATPTADQPSYLNGAPVDSTAAVSTQSSASLGTHAPPLQYPADTRLPYSSASHAGNAYSNFGAYLSAHRGSA